MCENCAKHGDGGKWFLNAKNYSEDLLSDIRRRKAALDFLEGNARMIGKRDPMDSLNLVPKPLKPLVNLGIVKHMQWNHYGQVVTLQEIRGILDLVVGVVRIPCVCRRITLGEEHRYCFGLVIKPGSESVSALVDNSYWKGPDGSGLGLEALSPDEALPLFEAFDSEGLVHSIWTLGTPFIASICNCSPKECRALKAGMEHDLQVMHPGEGVAALDTDSCVGCGRCVKRCHVGALKMPLGQGRGRKVHLDMGKCLGCGLCMEHCRTGALSLLNR